MTNKNISRRSAVQTIGAGSLIGLAGCSSSSDSPNQSDPYGSSTSTTGGDDGATSGSKSATVALATDLTAGTWGVYGGVMPYYTNILEPLIWVSKDMKLEPWLATEWKATGETTWEFTLRKDVTFHNGKPLTAEAVVFSFHQLLDEWSWAPGWLHVEKDGVKALDETTVEFTTTDPFPTFPGTIAHNMVAIQHPDRDRKAGEAIGTGPFKVENVKKEQFVQTTAFKDYWNEPPKLSGLKFRVITDANTRALSLSAHETDVAYQPPRNKINSIQKASKTNVETQGSPSAGYLGINLHKSPTDDVKFRKALNYAVNQNAIVESILSGVGKPARGSIAPSIYWSAHDQLPEYGPNKSKAKSLVKSSNYDGEALKLLVSTDMTDGKLLAQAVAQQMEAVGVTINIQVLEDAAFNDAERNGQGHLALSEKGTNSGAADYVIYESFHSEGDMNERLYGDEGTGLYNLGSKVDSLLETGFQTGSKEKKKEVYREVQRMIAEKAVIVPLYYSEYVVVSFRDVNNLDLRPIPEMVRWNSLTHTN
ncbi:ABC transporter substrate-binding protein [Haladaptatus sp. DFWS20]|uniref:ABC transporter substrate-binding protein n=1 Tax=Haladaptatus sp. DFWS20 TaxID=3403467 RepID=UPI003EBF3B39